MSLAPLLMLPIFVLGGFFLLLFIGRRRCNLRNEYIVPARGGPELPIFEKAKRKWRDLPRFHEWRE